MAAMLLHKGASHCPVPGFGTPLECRAFCLLQATLSSRHYMRGERFDPANPAGLGFSARAATQGSSSSYRMPEAAAGGAAAATMAGRGRSYSGARAAYGDYPNYPEGRPIFLPEAERFGNPPDLPSLLLQQRVIYISMPVSNMLAASSPPPLPSPYTCHPMLCM